MSTSIGASVNVSDRCPPGGPLGNPLAIAIYNSLVAYWDMDDNTSTPVFLDSHSTNHLSVKNGVGAANSSTCSIAAGGVGAKIGRGFWGNNTPQLGLYIPRSNTNLDCPDTDHSYGGWLDCVGGDTGSARLIMGRIGGGLSHAINGIYSLTGAGYPDSFAAYADGVTAVIASGGNMQTTGEKRFIIVSFDRTNSKIRIRGKSSDADYMVEAAFPSALYSHAGPNFCISGGLETDSTWFSGTRQMSGNGVADNCLYRNAVTTEAEFLYLYNSNVGMNYATLKTAAGH